MAKRNYRAYTDKFRAAAVVMLMAQGYPEKIGTMAKVSSHLKVAPSTLRGWYLAERNPPPTEMRDLKKGDLVALLENEVQGALEAMPDKRVEADYRELATAVGIMVDKLRLLRGESTENTDTHIKITYADTDDSAI